MSLDVADLIRFFESKVFKASDARHGKSTPDPVLHVARRMQVEPR